MWSKTLPIKSIIIDIIGKQFVEFLGQMANKNILPLETSTTIKIQSMKS